MSENDYTSGRVDFSIDSALGSLRSYISNVVKVDKASISGYNPRSDLEGGLGDEIFSYLNIVVEKIQKDHSGGYRGFGTLESGMREVYLSLSGLRAKHSFFKKMLDRTEGIREFLNL